MKYVEDPTPISVRSAYEVADLWESNQNLRSEVARLQKFEQMYHELLNESVKRGQEDIGNWMKLLMSDRIKFLEPTNG